MAMTAWLSRLAGDAPIPVFVVRGIGGGDGMAVLRASAGVSVVDSPRHATILVVAGRVPRTALPALAAVADQVPRPCQIVAIGVAGDLDALGLGEVAILSADDPVAGLRRAQQAVLSGAADVPFFGPRDNPVDWQGKGSNGQGGDGMMGGVPYGRMMPMPPVEGRDGLALDRLNLILGPFLHGLPAGVMMTVGLQGDVLETVELEMVELSDGVVGQTQAHPLTGRAAVAARALAALSQMCALAGLPALATRAARVAIAPTSEGIRDLRSRLDNRWGLRAATDHLAAGRPGGSGTVDVTARWQAWLDMADTAVAPAASGASGGADQAAHDDPTPDGYLDAVAAELRGQDIGQAWLTLCAHQVELEELAEHRLALVETP